MAIAYVARCMTAAAVAYWVGSGGRLCDNAGRLCVCIGDTPSAYCMKSECSSYFSENQKVRYKNAYLNISLSWLRVMGHTSSLDIGFCSLTVYLKNLRILHGNTKISLSLYVKCTYCTHFTAFRCY